MAFSLDAPKKAEVTIDSPLWVPPVCLVFEEEGSECMKLRSMNHGDRDEWLPLLTALSVTSRDANLGIARWFMCVDWSVLPRCAFHC